jgi:predicted GNAT family N-acyltransferase
MRFEIRAEAGAPPRAAREIRRRVFVDEQGVAAHEEWDEHDAPGAGTLHLVAYAAGRPVGCARLRSVGDAAKVERVAVLPDARRHGLGRALMEAAEQAARERGHTRFVLHAQVAVIPFYERLGWRVLGPEFEEAGIPHRKMEKRGARFSSPPASSTR